MDSYLVTAPHAVDDDEGRVFSPGDWIEIDAKGDLFKDYIARGWLTKASTPNKKAGK